VVRVAILVVLIEGWEKRVFMGQNRANWAGQIEPEYERVSKPETFTTGTAVPYYRIVVPFHIGLRSKYNF
jgi:hypothetical protein